MKGNSPCQAARHRQPLKLAASSFALASLVTVTSLVACGPAWATAGNQVIGTVSNYQGDGPNRIAVTPDGSKSYVTNSASRGVSVVDNLTGSLLRVIPIKQGTPTNLAVSPDGKKVYVLNLNPASISVIDTGKDDFAQPSQVQGYDGKNPYGIAFDPAPGAHSAYVTNNDANASVSIIDTTTDSQSGKVSGYDGSQGAQGVAFSPDGTIAYVTTPSSVVVIDAGKNAQKTVVFGYTGSIPLNLAFTPDGTRAYVTNQQSNSVSVISTQDNSQLRVIGSSAGFTGVLPADVAINPDGKTAYVTNWGSNSVSVIDLTKDRQIASIPLGSHPNGVAFSKNLVHPNQAGSLAYVANNGSASVSIIQARPASAVISSIFPRTGSLSGGTTVTIAGAHFTNTTRVLFNGNEGSNLKLISDSELTVDTPKSAQPQTVDVVVKNDGGDGEDPKAFTYVTSFAPHPH
jgi:YVTN family beta-propeller protein